MSAAPAQVRFYEPADLTLGVDAGMTPAELDTVLAAHGQFLPLDVPGAARFSIREVLDRHLSGPLRHGFGTVRDFTIGVEFRGGDAVIHGGGRVVKNVAGYDLMKLVIGARGAFGEITGVNFKVFPRPQQWETTLIAIEPGPRGWAQAETLRSLALHSPLRLMALELAVAVRAPEIDLPERCVLARYAGSAAVRERFRRELAAMARAVEARAEAISAAKAEAELWKALAEWPRAGEDVSLRLPPAQAAASLPQLHAAAASAGLGRLGVGAYWWRLAADEAAAAKAALQTTASEFSWDDLGWARGAGGPATDGPDPVARDLMRQLRVELSPRGPDGSGHES